MDRRLEEEGNIKLIGGGQAHLVILKQSPSAGIMFHSAGVVMIFILKDRSPWFMQLDIPASVNRFHFKGWFRLY